jgi:Tfp pilus assembly protein PilF
MNKLFNWTVYCLLAFSMVLNDARAQSADEDYIAIYKLIKQADQYRDTGLSEQAATAYATAAKQLQTFQKTNPSWNQRVIQFRTRYVTREMGKLPNPVVLPSAPVAITNDVAEDQDEKIQAVVAEATNELGGQVQALNLRIEQLQEENRLYVSKLREAMSAKPAGFNPEELQQAENRIMELQKEKQLLLVKLEQEANVAKASGQTENSAKTNALREQLNAAQGTIEQQQSLIASLRQEVVPSTTTNVSDNGQNRDQLIQELMEQNALLRRKVQDSTSNPPSPAPTKVAPAPKQARRSGRGWWPFSRKGDKGMDDRWLEAKLAAYEAERVPYRSEELALMQKQSPGQVKIQETSQSPIRNLNAEQTASAARLEAQARQAAGSGDLATAADRFKAILNLAPNDVSTLANLALIQMQMNAMADAESTLQRALSIDPQHTYALFLSGLLKINQSDFDGALGYLAQAAKLDPNDAEVQNHLGVVLSELGQRDSGEAALRKAVQLQPEYTDAHINLAVVYASQNPPYKELAKYHYQLALQAGHSKDPRLERLIEGAE